MKLIYQADKSISKEYNAPVLLSNFLHEIGADLSMPCNGRGICGKCRVRAIGSLSEPTDKERELLGDEIQRGVRLACMTTATDDAIISPVYADDKVLSNGHLPQYIPDEPCDGLGLAVDIGTTTIAAYLCSLSDFSILQSAGVKNPQGAFGADVMSRLTQSLEGKGCELADCIRRRLVSLATELCDRVGRPIGDLKRNVICGNTAMLYLLTNKDVTSIAKLPFRADENFGREFTAEELGLPFAAYLSPIVSAYVGGDLSCAVTSTRIYSSDVPAMVCDIGTNGEIALFAHDRIICASAAAGPAFEGAGIDYGMRASEGAISHVRYENGKVVYDTVGGGKAFGICGSGLVDAIAVMLDLGVINNSGVLNDAFLRDHHDERVYYIGDSDVFISQKDIRSVQLAKGAICAGIHTVLRAARIEPSEVGSFVIAGGFGSSIDPVSAEKIGLIPKGFAAVASIAGNAAGMGAVMTLLSSRERAACEVIARAGETAELGSSKFFMYQYIQCMNFGDPDEMEMDE